MAAIQVNYEDAQTLATHKNSVVAFAQNLIDTAINARLNNGLVGQARLAAIARLQGPFNTNIAQIKEVLEMHTKGTQAGMDGFAAIDQAGAGANQ